MLAKYVATLAVAVFLATFAASSLQFATRSQVLGGKAVDEIFRFEFTIDADSSHTYQINPSIKKFLEDNISFYTEGPAHVASATVEVTPKDVSWTENRTTITSTGAGISAHVKWDTPADSANGAHGQIFLNVPEIPGLEGKTPHFHSGGYQKDDKGRYVVREKGMHDVTVLIGGIIPEPDIPALKKAGIAEVFLPGTPTQAIVDFIRQRVSTAPKGA